MKNEKWSCPVCGEEVVRRSVLQMPGAPCPQCARRARDRARRERRRAAGLCTRCGASASGRPLCAECLSYRRSVWKQKRLAEKGREAET